MHETLIIKLLMLLAVANGTPVAAKLMLGDTLVYPLDAGVRLPDGQPLFGRSKTVRGIAQPKTRKATATITIITGMPRIVPVPIASQPGSEMTISRPPATTYARPRTMAKVALPPAFAASKRCRATARWR